MGESQDLSNLPPVANVIKRRHPRPNLSLLVFFKSLSPHLPEGSLLCFLTGFFVEDFLPSAPVPISVVFKSQST